MARINIIFCVLFAVFACAYATNSGNQQSETIVDGRFIVFADKTIHVIEPVNNTVIANITTDQSGAALTNADGDARTWNEAVFLSDSNVKSGLVFVNEGDPYTQNGAEVGYTTVLRTGSNPAIIGRVAVGGRPVNLFSINRTNSVWTRSGADGLFHVISVQSLSPFNATTKTVKAYVNTPNTGVLVISPSLSPVAYGTNVAEQVIFKYDVSNASLTNSYNFASGLSGATNCSGLNSAVYSPINKHLYAECVNDGGVLEWDTVANKVVAQHAILGTITAPPAGDRVLATQLLNSTSTIIVPGANGASSTVERVIDVGGQPDTPVFWSNSTDATSGNFSSYTVFYPLARNTQKYLVRATNDGVTDASYYSKPTDCDYDDSSVSASSVSSASTGLTLAKASNGTALTPTCGACAAGIQTDIGNVTDFYWQLGGFGVLPLGGTATNTTTVQAGAIQPRVNAATGANECSFATPSRAAKRGGDYVVTVADLPQASLYIVPGESSTNAISFVPTASRPRRLVWSPTTSF